MEKFSDWLKKRQITAGFSLAAIAGGFLFLRKGMTGMAILESNSPINPLSIIGLCLIICAVVLVAYSLKNR